MHEHEQPACRAELADGADAEWNAAESFFLYELARVLGSSPDHASLIGSITDGVCALLACEVALVHLNQAGRPVLQGWPELAVTPSAPAPARGSLCGPRLAPRRAPADSPGQHGG